MNTPFEFREKHAGRLSWVLPTWNDLITSGKWDDVCGWMVSGLKKELELEDPGSVIDDAVLVAAVQEWVCLWHKRYYRQTKKGVEVFHEIDRNLRNLASSNPAGLGPANEQDLLSRFRRPYVFKRALKTVFYGAGLTMKALESKVHIPGEPARQKGSDEDRLTQDRVMRAINFNYGRIYS